LNWALAGYRRLRERGYFLQPDSARDAIADLEALGSPVKVFVGECCIVEPGQQCTPDVLYDAWKAWCTRQGRKEPGTLQNFGRDLRAAVPGVRMVQPRTDGGRVRLYEGIGIRY
jgi:putative DNA primase/helicase